MITTSPDGQWAVIKRDREVVLLAGGAGPASAQIELPTEEADLVLVGPPSVLAVVTRGIGEDGEPCNRLVLYMPPTLEAVARLDLEAEMRIAGVTGSRLILVSMDGKAVTIVRIAGRALGAQPIDPGSPVEFAVGLERNQVLFGLLRKLESWDAVSGRPLLRVQLPLPPPPRIVGPAHGHLWLIRPGGDAILVCRLSDGRPFQHALGVTIEDVIYHPSSPLLVLVTARGLVRLHCFAHSMTVIDAPWRPGMELAQLVVGDDISLLGMAEDDDEPWRVPIAGAGAAAVAVEPPEGGGDPGLSAADKLRTMRERPAAEPGFGVDRVRGLRLDFGDRSEAERAPLFERTEPPHVEPPRVEPPRGELPRADPPRAEIPRVDLSRTDPPRVELPRTELPRTEAPRTQTWRDPLAGHGAELIRGGDGERPAVAADSELGRLAQRLGLSSSARHALIALYAVYLVGEPAVPLARLAHILADWTEPLGQGELGALAMLRRRRGKVRLRSSVCDLLDGAAPRAIRVIGDAATAPRRGATRLARDGRSDAAIESELARKLGRIAVIEAGPPRALLEARLHGATAVALAAPPALPLPWPRDAGLIVVAEASVPAWVAALPELTVA